jgi:hypothetical protein
MARRLGLIATVGLKGPGVIAQVKPRADVFSGAGRTRLGGKSLKKSSAL